jgi:hypothetical protein
MSHEMKPGLFYRMPVHFGPTAGPRQGPDGRPFDLTRSPRRRAVSVSFLSDAKKLDAILPPGFRLAGEPVVTVEFQYFTELEWLGGRGYNTLGVRFPAAYEGKRDRVAGTFLAVLWENLTDPILSGREELGFNKLYAELPEPRVLRGREIYGASWLGHRFLQMELSELRETPVEDHVAALRAVRSDGILHFKYVPRTGTKGEADVAYATLTPVSGNNMKFERVLRGQGTVEFLRATWEEMPTQFHIVNALADLPRLEMRGAVVAESRGYKDLSDQMALS